MKQLFLDKDFKNLIIKLNTEEQLFKKGINSQGISLEAIGGGYSAYTIFLKEQKGQPIDKVTLKDTGEFYKSFDVILTGTDFKITADTIKGDKDLLREWGEDILGITDDNLNVLIDEAKKIIIPVIKEQLLRR